MGELGVVAGTVIAGRYAVGARIGSGGMGAVYEGVHIVTRRPCAIKLMLGHTAEREEMRARFFRESRALAQIKSEYIVDVLDAGIDPDTHVPFLVMERLHGIDLGQLVVKAGALPPADVLLYLWHTALALDRTHRAAIVHRDLKASNLFLTQREDGTPLVKVLDFGIAKMMRLDATSERGTQSIGTPLYMAPEQFRGSGRVSPATDIYALGMLAYLLLVGSHYWREEREECENPFAFASIAVKGPIDPASVRAARSSATVPGAFDAWFARATAVRGDARFPSAIAAITELASALGLPAPVQPPKSPAGSQRVFELMRSHDGLTENIGPCSGVQLAPALSFTDSMLSGELKDGAPGEATEMPLSLSNASRQRGPRKRALRWLGGAAVAATAFTCFGLLARPATHQPLSKGLAATHELGALLGAQHAPSASPNERPLTPADLELVSSEPAARPAARRKHTIVRAAERPRVVEESPSSRPRVDSQSARATLASGLATPSQIDRTSLYRRD